MTPTTREPHGNSGASRRVARLVLVDDHKLVRDGLRAILDAEPDLEILGEAADGREALELCRSLRPDLVLMDVQMPGMDGLEATRLLKQHLPDTVVLVLTAHESEEYLLEAILAGASGYVLKDSPRQHLATAIRKAFEGESTLNRDLATRLLYQLAAEAQERQEPAPRPKAADLPQPLTPREAEVLKLLALGYTNRKIAQTLFISMGTVKNHIEHIFAKLEVSDRTRAVVRAVELGVLDPTGL